MVEEEPLPISELLSSKEPITTSVPGTPTDTKTAKRVLASQTHRLSARMFVESYLAGDYVKLMVLFRDSMIDAYQMRFISSRSATESVHYMEEIITRERQYEIQRDVLKENPDILPSFSSLVESVSMDDDGLLQLGYKCRIILEKAPRTKPEMMGICYKCGKRDEDQRRVLEGKERICPISINLDDYFGDTTQLPVLDTFKSNIPQWKEKWWEEQLKQYKHALELYRSINRRWYTQEMKMEDKQRWREQNPIGVVITNNLHVPLLEHTYKTIFVKEESNWRRWKAIQSQMKEEEEKMKHR